MNTQNLAERVFGIMRGLPPDDDGWTIVDCGDGIQVYGIWHRCKREPAQILVDEFMRRFTRVEDDRIDGTITSHIRRHMVTPSTSQRLWEVEAVIILDGITTSELLTSAATMCWEQSKVKVVS